MMPGILKDCNAERASRGEVVRHINTIPDHLPPPDTKRWTAPRKASVVAAVLSRRITVEEVCQRYDLAVGFAPPSSRITAIRAGKETETT
jgi:hypothetical protein